ncbi:hypothetical protein PM082_014634 [Marasmius tenuissimus]|nr:hypothetical protein PM082_014634 [Marasmius tenuissimus]
MTVADPIDFISRLPNEILIKIVEICVEEGQRCLDQDEISRDYPDEGWNGLHSQTALQLERCRDQPLTVFWNGWSVPDIDNQALGLTCAKSAQWRRADLSGKLSSFVDCSAYEMTFPELISLGLYLNDDIEGGEPQIIPDSLINARKLYELTLSGDSFNALTLPALRKLQIECDFPGPHGLFRLLNRSRCQLEEFEFVHGCIARATLLSHEKLQSVRALKLPGYVGSYSEDLMDSIEALQYPSPGEETPQSIVLPNLVSLTFTRAEFDDGVEEANALVRMVSSRRNVDHLPSTVARLQELIIQDETPFSIQDEATRAQFGKLCDEGLESMEVRDC